MVFFSFFFQLKYIKQPVSCESSGKSYNEQILKLNHEICQYNHYENLKSPKIIFETRDLFNICDMAVEEKANTHKYTYTKKDKTNSTENKVYLSWDDLSRMSLIRLVQPGGLEPLAE